MKQFLLLLAILQIMTSCKGQENNTTFSQTISDNEKQLSAILDTLDNPYYWQTTPLDRMGYVPPGAYDNFDKKYPFRTQLRQLLDSIKIVIEKPMSESYLLTLLAPKYTHKLDVNYRKIADKLIAFHSDSTNLKLWNIAIAKYETDREYVYDDLRAYVIWEFVRKGLLKKITKPYILKNKLLNANYYNYLDKEIDLLIIDEQIKYLETELKKENMGDAPRWAGLLFDKMISPKKYCGREYEYYLRYDNQFSASESKENVDLTIKILKEVKANYDQIHIDCKLVDDKILENEKKIENQMKSN